MITGTPFDSDLAYCCERGFHPDSIAALHWLNEKSGKHFRVTDRNLSVISARLRERGVDLPGVKMMIERMSKKWKGTRFEEFLRPETLFCKSKFDGYYASRSAPVWTQNTDDVPLHVQLKVLEERIGTHPANRASTKFIQNPAPEQIVELNTLRKRLGDVKAVIANGAR